MLRMILADDEPVITKGIQKLIDWNALGIEVVGVYKDGINAFEGILQERPDLALLDISMPKMTGIDIIKECKSLSIPTKIIFISGYQDFEYAKSAVKYGAIDYILKPVIRDELLTAIEKCVTQGSITEKDYITGNTTDEVDYRGLIEVEETNYVPILTQIVFQGNFDVQEKKLIRFSYLGFLESFLRANNWGITFEKNDSTLIVLKAQDEKEAKEMAVKIWEKAKAVTGQEFLLLIGSKVKQMSQISVAFEECFALKGYLFFADKMNDLVVNVGKTIFVPVDKTRFEKVKEDLISSIMNKDTRGFENQYLQFQNLVCRMADGKKEDACFYFCNMLRTVEEKIERLGCDFYRMEMQELLSIGRRMHSFGELIEAYHSILLDYMNGIQCIAQNSEKETFLKAREYITNHYTEDLTLNIVAEQIHMNPYYFSVFFKKNAGENYKSYLSKIRLEETKKLLVSTNLKTFDIALRVGFTDTRILTDTFQKYYGETPYSYRKRIREN